MGVAMQWNGLDKVIGKAGKRLKQHRAAMLHDVGETLVSNTKLRFMDGVDPEGKKWEPSERAKGTPDTASEARRDESGRFLKGSGKKTKGKSGGKTLMQSGDLRRSIEHAVTHEGVLIGSGKKYARIHQYGGTIRPKKGKYLKFKGQDGNDVFVKEVTIPDRPYLGFNDADREDVEDVLQEYMKNCFHK